MDRMYIDIVLATDQRMQENAVRASSARDVTPSRTTGELPPGVSTTAVATARIDGISHPDYDILERNRREFEPDPIIKGK